MSAGTDLIFQTVNAISPVPSQPFSHSQPGYTGFQTDCSGVPKSLIQANPLQPLPLIHVHLNKINIETKSMNLTATANGKVTFFEGY